MFASKTMTEHVARGVVGLGALSVAVRLQQTDAWLTLLLIPLALVALRGCPMCWTVGLLQTAFAKLSGRTSAQVCVDGSCAGFERSERDATRTRAGEP